MQYKTINIDSQIIRYRYRICVINLIISLILMMIIWVFEQRGNFGLMLAFSIWGLYVYISLLFSELKYKGLNILLLYLIGVITHLAYPAYEMSLATIGGDKFSFLLDYTDYIFPTILAMNIWHMIFIISTTYFSKNKILALDISSFIQSKNIFTIIIIIYIIGILIRLFPQIIFFSDSIKLFIGYFPTLTLMLLSIYCAFNKDKRAFSIMILILIYEIYYAVFNSFTKNAIIVNFLFILLYYFLRQKNEGKNIIKPKFVILISLFMVFVIFFVFPFMNMKRFTSSWDALTGKFETQYSNMDIIEDVLSGEAQKFYNTTNYGKSSSEGFFERSNSIPYNAYIYMSGDKESFNPILIKGTMTYLLPRFLRGGKEHDVSLNYHLLTTSYINAGSWDVNALPYNSGTPTGAFGGAYLWGGWFAVVLVCILNAFVFSKVLLFCISYQRNLFSLVLILMILMNTLGSFEETHDGGVSRDITYIMYVFLVYSTSKFFGIKREKLVV